MTDAPYEFISHADVRAFLWARISERSLTLALVARGIGAPSDRAIPQLLTGRQRITRSKYFEPLCHLLDITHEQRDRMRRTDQPSKPDTAQPREERP